MDRQSRNTKKALKALVIVGIILLLALVGAVVYFYALNDKQSQEEELNKITCGCYMIDPAVVNECGDPKRAFLFNINTVDSDQTCNATCDINQVADNLLNSTTAKETYKSCTVRSISDTRCENMILKDQDGKIITGRIKPTDEINVEATFDKSTYTDYSFKINTESFTPDSTDGNKITKKITNFEGLSSVEVLATAKDLQGDQINSIVCRRVVDIQTAGSTTVTTMSAITEQQSDGKTKVSQISISVGQLASNNVKIKYSFGDKFATITAKSGITVESSKGSITMSKLDLYDATNFESQSFDILNNHLGDLTITTEVFVDDISIGSASTKVIFTQTDVTPQQPATEEPITEAQKSNFTTTKTSAQSCVERVEGSNLATFTITVKNNKDVADSITSIKDKLPLGFIYSAATSTVNGSTVTDASMVTITPVGESQEIVWQPSSAWSLPAQGNLVITFQATASSTAISGQNQNEVIVNPVEIPLDPATLRAEAMITVAQDCDNITEEEQQEVPSTGIFDNFIIRIGIGILILITGWIIYTRPEGTTISSMIVESRIYSDVELTKYKVTDPKKYFEEKILRGKSRGSR
ncbi:MAG: hypothetical protein UR34_C0012G0012 [candidate division WS6 bacterium GW2011_GWC1_33_20]|uniref:DUF11 domain-containing protein n=2 Tax=Candidatus Dojkabacteria TaxID=74243 RepID=A0A0G0AF27_9BACT|nr:MAG: hypothetical protein UR32_C0005G0024 [candidate division WS6 bacterium GW2011_GWE2_33_157]KKP43660.1 MAG: hypothetical protein UR34_C0012G0012 [candidate division WS6 bacterium GW2011_GWC1_33_20]KKP45379.1 MAG: hypothetical protein UR36_C0008G0020 [candidate division WS6 bacterium GW2011_GWF1_33_233]KKP54693.1 MAG: hypothetical protein UR45_C0010G0012 [candidate division WS6 bacterium GW2011_WS6_33_547]KKP55163.1 MAG: hypothetical protein UR47_C0004G0012 [candidate division WS6 bacteriu